MVNTFMSILQKTYLLDLIRKKAISKKALVAIGIEYIDSNIIKSIESAYYLGYAKILLVGNKQKLTPFTSDIEIINTNNSAKCIVNLLVTGKVDAVVRGNISASLTLNYLKTKLKINKLHRAALLNTVNGTSFFITPIGIDEGNNIDDKIKLVQLTSELLKKFDITANVGIVSGGRMGDIGRSERVDRTLADGELLANYFNNTGINAKHYTILIEDAIKEANIILVPDGISGNLIFRTLVYLGSGESMGAPIMLDKHIFVDTSRAKDNYTNSIMLASALADIKN